MRRLRAHAVPSLLGTLGVALFVASPSLAGSDTVHADGPLTTYGTTVDPLASAVVDVDYDAGGWTHVELELAGFARHTAYAGRVREGGCPPMAHDLGPVFQQAANPDPALPEDPFFRNEHNEVWLDVETGARGEGAARATQKWQFHPLRRPGSVTIHQMLPKIHPKAPVVGTALACVEVAF